MSRDEAKKIFKQLKAGIRKYEDLSDDELKLLLRYYPYLFPCEYIEEGVVCGNPSYIIIVTLDNKYIPVCKRHYVKLTLSLLFKGHTIRYLR